MLIKVDPKEFEKFGMPEAPDIFTKISDKLAKSNERPPSWTIGQSDEENNIDYYLSIPEQSSFAFHFREQGGTWFDVLLKPSLSRQTAFIIKELSLFSRHPLGGYRTEKGFVSTGDIPLVQVTYRTPEKGDLARKTSEFFYKSFFAGDGNFSRLIEGLFTYITDDFLTAFPLTLNLTRELPERERTSLETLLRRAKEAYDTGNLLLCSSELFR